MIFLLMKIQNGYNFNDTFSDPDDDILTLSARLSSGSGILPGWITFNAITNNLILLLQDLNYLVLMLK